jgi:hypothetical protein
LGFILAGGKNVSWPSVLLPLKSNHGDIPETSIAAVVNTLDGLPIDTARMHSANIKSSSRSFLIGSKNTIKYNKTRLTKLKPKWKNNSFAFESSQFKAAEFSSVQFS